MSRLYTDTRTVESRAVFCLSRIRKMAFTYKHLILWQVDSADSLFFCTRMWWALLFSPLYPIEGESGLTQMKIRGRWRRQPWEITWNEDLIKLLPVKSLVIHYMVSVGTVNICTQASTSTSTGKCTSKLGNSEHMRTSKCTSCCSLCVSVLCTTNTWK